MCRRSHARYEPTYQRNTREKVQVITKEADDSDTVNCSQLLSAHVFVKECIKNLGSGGDTVAAILLRSPHANCGP